MAGPHLYKEFRCDKCEYLTLHPENEDKWFGDYRCKLNSDPTAIISRSKTTPQWCPLWEESGYYYQFMDDLCDYCNQPFTWDFLSKCDFCDQLVCHWCYNNHGCETDGYIDIYDEKEELNFDEESRRNS